MVGAVLFSAGLPPAGKELWNTYTSLSDGASRAAFLRAARSVVDYRGQAVHAMRSESAGPWAPGAAISACSSSSRVQTSNSVMRTGR